MSHRNQGFFCPDCPKLFFNNAPPPPAASPAPGGSRKRSTRGLMTASKLFQMVTKERRAAPRASAPRDGIKIRGRWTASRMYPFFISPRAIQPAQMLPFQPRPRDRAGVLVLRLMGPSVSTVKIFSAFRKLASVHSSCSRIRTAMELSRRSSHPRAPTSPELSNKVPRGSRRRPRLPLRELYFIFQVPVRPTSAQFIM